MFRLVFMPASVAIHAVVFTAGALIGGGITATVVNRNRQQQQPKLPDHEPPPPAMDVITTGRPGALTGVLKYGNPGARNLLRVTKLPTPLQAQFQTHSFAKHMSPRMIGGSNTRLG